MSPSPPDRALRRLVANLAAEPSDDIRAILDRLEPGERRRVEQLLGEYLGSAPMPSTDRATAAPVRRRPAGVSANLLARLDDEGSFSITTHAREALRDVAASMTPAQAPPAGPGAWSVFEAWRGRRLRGGPA